MRISALLFVFSLVPACSGDHVSPDAGAGCGDGAAPVSLSRLASDLVVANDLACAIGRDDGLVRCWGQFQGFVYSLDSSAGAAPTLVPDVPPSVAIDASSDHACAVGRDGSVWCWGYDTWGQLGLPRENPDDGDAFHARAVHIDGLDRAVDVAVGWLHSCALLESGQVACWGGDDLSALPVDIAESYSQTPVLAPGLDHVVRLTAHGTSTCALRQDGGVVCFGENAYGEDGPSDGMRMHTIVIPPAADVITSDEVTFALGRDGTVQRWGMTLLGASHGTPMAIGTLPIGRLVVTRTSLCSIDAAGALACIDIGGTDVDPGLIEHVMTGLPPMQSLGVGFRHVCALGLDGVVSCRGSNGVGQIGVGTRGNVAAADARITLHDVQQMARGGGRSCARTSDGAYCWGGHIETGRSGSPVRVPLDSVTAIAVGYDDVCAIANGDVSCWGSNVRGISDPASTTPVAAPHVVALPGAATAIVMGDAHACALTDRGVYCWGDDEEGETGDATYAMRTGVARVAIENVVALAAGQRHTCAIVSDGSVACWGDGRDGQLGAFLGCDADCIAMIEAGHLGAAHGRATPRVVEGIIANELHASGHVTCAIGTASTWCWPEANDASVRTTSLPSPFPERDRVLVCGGAPILCDGLGSELVPTISFPPTGQPIALDFDSFSGCYVEGAHDLRCWGDNTFGQLGDGWGWFEAPTAIAL